jgi:hypothetical protein
MFVDWKVLASGSDQGWQIVLLLLLLLDYLHSSCGLKPVAPLALLYRYVGPTVRVCDGRDLWVRVACAAWHGTLHREYRYQYYR